MKKNRMAIYDHGGNGNAGRVMAKDLASRGQVDGPNVEPTNDLRQQRPPFSVSRSPPCRK